MSNNLCVNVLNGFNYQMFQFQVSSAYTKRAMAKNVKKVQHTPFSPTNDLVVCFMIFSFCCEHRCRSRQFVRSAKLFCCPNLPEKLLCDKFSPLQIFWSCW